MTDNDNRDDQDLRAEFEAALGLNLKEGQVVTGKIVQVLSDAVVVDVGYKSEGTIPLHELTHRKINSPADLDLKVGDEIRVQVVSVDRNGEGGLRLSKRRGEEAAAWERVKALAESGEIVEAHVVEAVKGGLVVDLGLRAFMPASLVERGYVNDLSKYVGQPTRVQVIEIDRHKNRVIVSRKKVLESERDTTKSAFWSNAEEGQIRKGTVKSLTEFGAFLDLGGVDGLLHVSEMSYGRVKNPSEVVSLGDELDVVILRLDREKGKVSLGRKQILSDPWEHVAEKYAEGTVVTGKVARIAAFGAFVELEPGVDGLVHISQLADRHVRTPDEVVKVGDEVRAKVVGLALEQRRISLSIREADAPTDATAAE